MATLPFLDRVLPRRVGTRRFAAIVNPHGIQAVEYGRERGGLSLLAGIRQKDAGGDPEEMADGLADAIEAMGGRGGELVLALGGFGTAHHILTLPRAEVDVLRPIVRRELLRYYPNLDDPEVDFVLGAPVDSSPPKREVLVGAVPRKLAIALARALENRGIELRHITVLPEVLQTLYDTFEETAVPTVMVVVMESGLLIGCFHQGALRLFIEPPQDVHGRPLRDPEAVTEQVERANLFLRQQFPGVSVNRVLLAAPAGEYPAVEAALKAELDSKVVRMADAPAGSLAALGAALDADSASPLQLLPLAVRPRSDSERWTRRLAALAGAVAMAAAVWWAGAGMTVARAQAEQARAMERQVQPALQWLNQAERTLEARQAHEARLAFLGTSTESQAEVRRILAAVAASASPQIRLDTLDILREGDGWALSLMGRAEGRSSAAAVRAVDALYRGLPDRLPAEEVELGELRDVAESEAGSEDGAGGAPVAIGFHMSFIVQWPTDSTR